MFLRFVSIMVLLLTGTSLLGADASSSLTFFFSGYVRGAFGPCGWKNNPTGGLARRAGYSNEFAQTADGPTIQVDLGNYFTALGPSSKEINELMLESLDRLPIRVLNLAPQDLFLWPQLAARDSKSSQFISTNLRPKSSSLAAPPKSAVLELDAIQLDPGRALRLGFLGVSDPKRVRPNSGFEGTDPSQAVSEVLSTLRSEVDIVVVLADLNEAGVQTLVTSNPGIDVVLRAEQRYVRYKPRLIGDTLLVSSVERARYLGQLTLRLSSSGEVLAVEPELIEMKEGVTEDPEFLQKQEALKQRFP